MAVPTGLTYMQEPTGALGGRLLFVTQVGDKNDGLLILTWRNMRW